MNIHNGLPILIRCLKEWKKIPYEREFIRNYAEPMAELAGDFFEGYHEVLHSLDWDTYRAKTLEMDSEREELRLRKNLKDVETLFEFKLEGEIILFGSFETMDGYARFDRGTHRVFLGVDESFANGKYIDVLTTHELTHVARESRAEVWEGFGLNPKMTQGEFTDSQPVIEHLMGEGFSCAISEILVPGQDPWGYAYQSKDSLRFILENGASVDQTIRKELKHPDGDYGRLYRGSAYSPRMPSFTHYVWAWQWAKHVLHTHCDGDPRKLVSRCSKDFIADALTFQLKK